MFKHAIEAKAAVVLASLVGMLTAAGPTGPAEAAGMKRTITMVAPSVRRSAGRTTWCR